MPGKIFEHLNIYQLDLTRFIPINKFVKIFIIHLLSGTGFIYRQVQSDDC